MSTTRVGATTEKPKRTRKRTKVQVDVTRLAAKGAGIKVDCLAVCSHCGNEATARIVTMTNWVPIVEIRCARCGYCVPMPMNGPGEGPAFVRA